MDLLLNIFVTFHSSETFNKWIKYKWIVLHYPKPYRNVYETLQNTVKYVIITLVKHFPYISLWYSYKAQTYL